MNRRTFLGTAAMSLAVARLGTTAMEAKANIQGDPFGAIKQVDAGVLNVGYVDLGPRDGPAMMLLHGWPYDIHSYVDVAPMLAARGYRVIVPYVRGYGTTRFLSGNTMRNGQQSALAADTLALMDALHIDRAIVAGFDWGARTACAMAALWPERCKGLVSVSGYIIVNLENNRQPLTPAAEQGWWYQYYFSTERGRLGYGRNRHAFAKLIWKNASPLWNFDDATFDRSARSFDNPDHVDIVIHNYRWRLSLAPGEDRYADLEAKLQEAPVIKLPAITIGSDFDGAAADGKGYATKFTGSYSHRILDGIGHNLPQEAPEAFCQALVDVDEFE